ncbi:hypothetical protein NW810_04625, partial [Synechococcus sp. W60.2]
MGEAVFAQLDPLPTNLEGYQRFWAAQRSRDPGSEPVAPTGASLLGDPITLAEAQSSSRLAATAAPSVPPLPASAPVEGSPPEKALTPEELNRQRLQPLLAEGAAAHARRQAQQAQAQATPSSRSASSTTPTAAVPTLDSLRSSQPATSQAADLQVEEQPGQHPNEARRLPVPPPGSTVESLAAAQGQERPGSEAVAQQVPTWIPQAGGNWNWGGAPSSTGTQRAAQTGTEAFTPTAGSLLAPQLLERFPLLRDLGDPATGPEAAPPASQGSQIRQQLAATATAQIPLDPAQINVSGDVLSYLAEQDLGIAEGNAQIQLADGTSISGERLLFYRRERRLRSDGPFRMEQPPGPQGRGIRQIEGRNLDLDIPGRSAQFESSLVILPGEEPGTKVFVRSQETTA